MLCALLVPSSPPRPAGRRFFRPALGLLGCCFIWIVLLPLTGWLPATVLAAFSACMSGGCSFKESLMLSLVLTLVLWLGMERLLAWPLPHGLLFSFIGD